jgi:hypothetical protein
MTVTDKSLSWLIKYLIQGEKDWEKFETARKLKTRVDSIRLQYTADFKSKEMKARQRAVALYFIDKVDSFLLQLLSSINQFEILSSWRSVLVTRRTPMRPQTPSVAVLFAANTSNFTKSWMAKSEQLSFYHIVGGGKSVEGLLQHCGI